MGDKEEVKPNILEEVVRAENASERHVTGAEDLLSAMSAMSIEEVKPEAKKPHKTRWQPIFIACCCLLAVVIAGLSFLHVDAKINAVVKDLNTLKAQRTAPDTKEQLAAEMQDLKATNAQLRAEVKKIKDTIEALKARKENVAPAQRKRR